MNLLCRIGFHRGTTWNQFILFDDLVWQTIEYCPRCKKIVYNINNDIVAIVNKDTILRIIGPHSEEVKDIFIKYTGDVILHRNILPLKERQR